MELRRTLPLGAKVPTPLGAHLVVLTGPARGTRHDLAAGTAVLGRDGGCDLPLPSPAVSARHARIARGEAGLAVEDLGSRNGTRVRGEALARGERRALRHGDVVEVGDVSLVLLDPAAAATARSLGRLAFDEAAVGAEVDALLEGLLLTPRPGTRRCERPGARA
jgi:pSer/pThr/pTyr-binding forkhead associated (FHA) protein